jgi:hypothetical protein
MAEKAQIPAKYINEAGDDFASPLAAVLQGIGLLGQDNKDSKEGLNELQEGALSFSKWLGGLAGAGGLAGVVTAIVGAFSSAHEPTRVALVSGGSLIAVAAVIALALVVQGDARARAASTVAQYEARSQISSAFLTLTSSLLNPSAAATKNGSSSLLFGFAPPPTRLRVKAKDHDKEMSVTGVRRTSDGEVQVKLDDGDWVPESDVETFHVDADG